MDYVLEGTIRWQPSGKGSRVRVTPQLIRVDDDTHLWANVYDEGLSDVFKVQSDIATRVASALQVKLLEPERHALEAKPTENSEAYQLYLRGKSYLDRGYNKNDLQIAEEMFSKAVNLDSSFALAYSELSMAHLALYWIRYNYSEERLRKAKEAVDKAFKLQPDLGQAHLAMGYYYYWGQLDYEAALKEFSIAEAQLPNDAGLLGAIGFVKRRQGKWEEGLAKIKRAFELNPRDRRNAFEVAVTYHTMHNYHEAEHYYDRAIALSPDWDVPYPFKAQMYVEWEGSTEKGREVLENAENVLEPSSLTSAWVDLETIEGHYQEALRWLSSPAALSHSTFGGNDTIEYFLTKAYLYGFMKQTRMAQTYYDSARVLVQALVRQHENDWGAHIWLAMINAGLGRKADALRETIRLLDLLPISRDAFFGTNVLEGAALVYEKVGEYDKAIDQLEHLVSIPSWISISKLRIDPAWAPLRGNPRFQKLIREKK